MPSWDLFEAQPTTTASTVLPPAVPTLAVEAGVALRLGEVGRRRRGIDRFGESAPGDVVLANFGYTAENVVERALALLAAERTRT